MGKIVPFVKPVSNQIKKIARGSKAGRRQSKVLFFERSELASLLSIYSGQVAKGLWRDYAVDFLPGQALFSVYRHAHEASILSISKQIQPNGKGREFVLYAGPRRIARSDELVGLYRAITRAAKQT